MQSTQIENRGDAPLGVWPGHTGNWNRWDNDRGTLNLITPAVVMRGVSAARLGEVVACARPTRDSEQLEPIGLFDQKMTHVRDVKDDAAVTKTQSAADMLTFRVHNLANTHIDALAHMAYNGYGYNGRRHSDVVDMADGAKHLDVTNVIGTVTRGRLLDVARRRGVDYIEPGDVVVPYDIEDFAQRLEPGDAAILRTGSTICGGRHSEHDARGLWSGIHPDCVEILAQRGISLIGGDSTEPGPSPVAAYCSRPFHVMCLVVYGIHIIHNMDLEELARRCHELSRDDFLLTVGALNVPGATGSPVTPLAVL